MQDATPAAADRPIEDDTLKARAPMMSPAAVAYLDALRGVCANLVVLSHVILIFFNNQVSVRGRGIAVSLLFVLSGFLITLSLMHRARRPGPHLPHFLADRVARIMSPAVPVILLIAMLNATVIHLHMGADGLSTGAVALLGNLAMLLDYPLFQLLAVLGHDVPWRIRPYNSAEPLWTLAIEFWLYIAAALLVFGGLMREQIRKRWLAGLALVSLPVLLWNAADGPGKSLSLIWALGGIAAYFVVQMGTRSAAARSRSLWAFITGFGALALTARLVKVGFDPYDLQTCFLVTLIFTGLYLRLNQATTVWRVPAGIAAFVSSYSYSLYLVHNTVLVIVLQSTRHWPVGQSVALSVVVSHACGLVIYHAFEKHHRTAALWLRPWFTRLLLKRDVPVPPRLVPQ